MTSTHSDPVATALAGIGARLTTTAPRLRRGEVAVAYGPLFRRPDPDTLGITLRRCRDTRAAAAVTAEAFAWTDPAETVGLWWITTAGLAHAAAGTPAHVTETAATWTTPTDTAPRSLRDRLRRHR